MSVYGAEKTATIALGETTSAEVDLGRKFDDLGVILPALTSCTLKLQVAPPLSPGAQLPGSYQDLGDALTTETTTGGYTDLWELGGFRWIKIVSSVAQASAVSFTVAGRAN